MSSSRTARKSNVSPILRELVIKLFAEYGEKSKKEAEEDPEAAILALVMEAEKKVRRPGHHIDYESATWYMKEARELLDGKQVVSMSA